MRKRIQLRGISRTPSDRMTEDGGCAESLNVSVDNNENIPLIAPKDATSDLGLPNDLVADRVFIHKTANYENYIIVQGQVVYSIINTSLQETLTLKNGESIKDISSLGNTIIISSSTEMYFLLFSEDGYDVLKDDFSKLHCSFVCKGIKEDPWGGNDNATDHLPVNTKSFTRVEENPPYYSWGLSEDEYEVFDEATLVHLNWLWQSYVQMLSYNQARGCFNNPILVRYAIRFYDDTYYYISSPIFLGAFTDQGTITSLLMNDISVSWSSETNQYTATIQLRDAFQIGFSRMAGGDIDLGKWRDVIKSVDVFISDSINPYPRGNTHARDMLSNGTSIRFDPVSLTTEKASDNISSYGTFYLIKSFPISDFFEQTSVDLEVLKGDFSPTSLATKEKLVDIQDSFSLFQNSKLGTFNNRSLLFDYEKRMPEPLPFLNGQFPIISNKGSGTSYSDQWEEYQWFVFAYHMEDGRVVVTDKQDGDYSEYYGGSAYGGENCTPFSYISYPSGDCVRVDVYRMQNSAWQKASVEMRQSNAIPNCSFAFIGYNKSLHSLEYEDVDYVPSPTGGLAKRETKLAVSAPDNPFSFPLASRYSFQSKIVGIAVATTTLSQGQFGQFPLYVFTEDGIWVMETGADGSFTTNKPLSREVCTNPDSITSLDNAVVFVTNKGVMMISGAEVINISPDMNGRHYVVDDVSKEIIKDNGFCSLIPALTDKDSFMRFIQDSTCSFDYASRRLVFISKSNPHFQYVYKMETRTWHKQSVGLNLIQPLNSYPEAYVQGEYEGKTRIYDLSTLLDTNLSQRVAKGCIVTRPFDLGEPDVKKTISAIRVRGQYQQGAVKSILLGSDDGINFSVINSFRGKSWKLFRLIILTDLAPTERVSWVDVEFETKFTNRLR